MFEIRVERNGDRPFLILPDDTAFTYEDIAEQTDEPRTVLVSTGVEAGHVVGLYL